MLKKGEYLVVGVFGYKGGELIDPVDYLTLEEAFFSVYEDDESLYEKQLSKSEFIEYVIENSNEYFREYALDQSAYSIYDHNLTRVLDPIDAINKDKLYDVYLNWFEQ